MPALKDSLIVITCIRDLILLPKQQFLYRADLNRMDDCEEQLKKSGKYILLSSSLIPQLTVGFKLEDHPKNLHYPQSTYSSL